MFKRNFLHKKMKNSLQKIAFVCKSAKLRPVATLIIYGKYVHIWVLNFPDANF